MIEIEFSPLFIIIFQWIEIFVCTLIILLPLIILLLTLLRGSLSFTSLSAVQIYDVHIFLTV